MEELAFCKTCGAEQESIFHAMFECTWAKLFWHEIKSIAHVKIPVLHPRSWATDIIQGDVVNKEAANTILCGCWAVWTERNAVWHGNGGCTVSASVRWVLDTTYDLAQMGKRKEPKPVMQQPSWKKPEPGTIKINVDAAFQGDIRQGVTGLVIRDHDGRMIRAQALWYPSMGSAMIMEAQDVLDAVRLASENLTQSVEIETDAQEVLKMMDDPGGGKSEIACICQEIKELSGFFASIKFSFVRRLANMAAHLCARKASEVRSRCVWINFTPSWLTDTLAKDCNHSG